MAAHQAPLSLGFSRQEHWSGLPFPSPMHKVKSEVFQSCPTLSHPMDCSLPGSSIHGIFQARVLEWGAIAFSTYQLDCAINILPCTSHSAKNFILSQLTLTMTMCVSVTQSYLTLFEPMDYSPIGSSVHGILQARILEWVAISFSRQSSKPRDRTKVSCIAGRFFTI